MSSEQITLPAAVSGWKLEGTPRRIDSANIFEYMDGAGELYLSFHFDHLMVYEYKAPGENDILVELYFMKESRDAFGLLSLDWGGEAVDFGPPGRPGPSETARPGSSIVPPSRALYGEGLLRVWSDDLYIRIMAFRETPEVKEAILQLGKMITAGRNNPPPPEFLASIEPSADRPWKMRIDRTAYFYSHLVLNSFFYLSHENILNMDASTEAVLATFEKERPAQVKLSVRLFAIRYPDAERASAALTGFIAAYLSDKVRAMKPDQILKNSDFFQVEDGWLGYRLDERHLALAFQCPDRDTAWEILARAVFQ